MPHSAALSDEFWAFQKDIPGAAADGICNIL